MEKTQKRCWICDALASQPVGFRAKYFSWLDTFGRAFWRLQMKQRWKEHIHQHQKRRQKKGLASFIDNSCYDDKIQFGEVKSNSTHDAWKIKLQDLAWKCSFKSKSSFGTRNCDQISINKPQMFYIIEQIEVRLLHVFIKISYDPIYCCRRNIEISCW